MSKTILSEEEENRIISIFNQQQALEDFSVVLNYEQIKDKDYSFNAGQYFDVRVEYTDLTSDQFNSKLNTFKENLVSLFKESKDLETEIQSQMSKLKYE